MRRQRCGLYSSTPFAPPPSHDVRLTSPWSDDAPMRSTEELLNLCPCRPRTLLLAHHLDCCTRAASKSPIALLLCWRVLVPNPGPLGRKAEGPMKRVESDFNPEQVATRTAAANVIIADDAGNATVPHGRARFFCTLTVISLCVSATQQRLCL